MAILKTVKKYVPETIKQWYRLSRYHGGIAWRTWMYDDNSQAGEVSVLRRLIHPDWPRYLVDVGANDGRTISNTYVFLRDGWTGLLLEPEPSVFARLQKTHAGRANAICLPVGAGQEPGEATLYVNDSEDAFGLGSTTNLDDNDEMIKRRTNARTLQIPIETLTNLLIKHRFPADFSLLSVDVEGCDLEVLQGLDFQQFRPRLIVTEKYFANPDRDDAKVKLLKANDYVLYQPVGCNELWGLPQFLPK